MAVSPGTSWGLSGCFLERFLAFPGPSLALEGSNWISVWDEFEAPSTRDVCGASIFVVVGISDDRFSSLRILVEASLNAFLSCSRLLLGAAEASAEVAC